MQNRQGQEGRGIRIATGANDTIMMAGECRQKGATAS